MLRGETKKNSNMPTESAILAFAEARSLGRKSSRADAKNAWQPDVGLALTNRYNKKCSTNSQGKLC